MKMILPVLGLLLTFSALSGTAKADSIETVQFTDTVQFNPYGDYTGSLQGSFTWDVTTGQILNISLQENGGALLNCAQCFVPTQDIGGLFYLEQFSQTFSSFTWVLTGNGAEGTDQSSGLDFQVGQDILVFSDSGGALNYSATSNTLDDSNIYTQNLQVIESAPMPELGALPLLAVGLCGLLACGGRRRLD